MRFFGPGDPVGKQRHREGRGHPYTPQKTKDYEARVALMCRQEMNRAGFRKVEHGPIVVIVNVWYRIPESASRAKKAAMVAGDLVPLKRPDIDNVVKSILDGMNGVAYKDDAQVAKLYAYKAYGVEPGVLVEIFGGD